MKIEAIGILAVGCLAVAGCDRLEKVVDLGQQAREETRSERERQLQAEERKASLRAERESLAALIDGKMLVLSNRITAAEAAIRTLRSDRAALSKELSAAAGGGKDPGGAGLERALASPVVNEIAMRYLKMDFSVTRGEYAEALAKARENEAEFKRAVGNLHQTFDGAVDPNRQAGAATRRARTVAGFVAEHQKLERRRIRLERERIPTGSVYANRRLEHDRELRNVDNRLREIERQIDQFRKEDESARRESDRIAERARENSLKERNDALERLEREYGKRENVLGTVQAYGEKTLRRLEQALVKESAALEQSLRKSAEGYLTLKGIRASVPALSSDGVKKLQREVQSL